MNTLLKKYHEISAPVKASIWFTICSVLQKGISLITIPIFTRILSTEQYGTFSIYNSWYSIIGIFATLNLSAGVYNNCMTKHPESRKEITSAFQGLSTTITCVLFVIYLSAMNFWNNIFQLSSLFVIAMFLELLFVPAYSFWTVGKRYDYKYVGIVIVTLLISLGSPLLGIVAVLATDYKAEARVLADVLVQVIIGLVFYIYNFRKGKTFFSKEYWVYALKFNLPLIPHYLSMTILNQADRIMIGRMVSNGAAAIYSIAYSVSSIMNIVTQAINSSFIPYTYKALKEKKYDGIRRNANFLLVLVGLVSFIAMAFGPEIVWIVGGKQYYDAIWVIPPVAASIYFSFLYPLFANVEFYYEKTVGIMIASCVGAISNIILNYIFIGIFGYYAAGYTTLACYILFAFAHYFFQRKILREKIAGNFEIYNMKLVVVISLAEIIGMIGMTLTYRNTIIRYSVLLLMAIALLTKKNDIIHRFKQIKENQQ